MSKYTVLIADDDKSQRSVQKLIFAEVAKAMGAELAIDESADSVETRKCLEDREYDLVIIDNEFKDDMIPGHLPGIAVLQLMRRSGPNMSSPAVFCTGDPYDTLKPMAEKYDALYYPKEKLDIDEMTEIYVKLLRK